MTTSEPSCGRNEKYDEVDYRAIAFTPVRSDPDFSSKLIHSRRPQIFDTLNSQRKVKLSSWEGLNERFKRTKFKSSVDWNIYERKQKKKSHRPIRNTTKQLLLISVETKQGSWIGYKKWEYVFWYIFFKFEILYFVIKPT